MSASISITALDDANAPDEEPSGQGTPIPLPAVFDMTATRTLAGEMKNLDLTGKPLVLDGEAVGRVGTPGLQLLCVLAAHAEQNGQRFVLQKPSQTLRNALIRIGLEKNLSVWEATP